MNEIKTAVILGGGLAAFDSFSIAAGPKFLLPIANRPLFHYLAACLTGAGVERLIFCVTPNLKQPVEAALAGFPPTCPYLVQETSLGTGGSLKEVAPWIKDGPFWVVGGDLLLAADLTLMLARHQARGAVATVASLCRREASWEMERLELGDASRVKAIHRIHPSQERRSILRPAGLYLCDPAILEAIPEGRYFDLKEQVFPALYEHEAPSAVWEIQGYCRSIITIDDFLFANQDVLLGRVDLHETLQASDRAAKSQAALSPSSRFYGSVAIGEGASLGEGVVVLGPSAIGPGCAIEPGAMINGCVLLGNNRIGRDVYLERCVVGKDAEVAAATVLHQTAIMQQEGAEVSVRLRPRTRQENGNLVQRTGWLNPAGKAYLTIKRLMDVIFSAVALIVCAPLLVIISLGHQTRIARPGYLSTGAVQQKRGPIRDV